MNFFFQVISNLCGKSNSALLIKLLKSILVLVLLSGCSKKENSNLPDEIRLGFMPDFTHAQAFVGLEKKHYALNLKGVKISPKAYLTGITIMRDVVAAELDFAFVDPVSAIISFSRRSDNAFKIVAGVSSGGVLFVAQRNIPPDLISEFYGNSVAVPEMNGTQYLSFRDFLSSKLSGNSELINTVSITPLGRNELMNSFISGVIVGAWYPEPWASKLIMEGRGYAYANESSLWTKSIFASTVLICRTDFMREYPDAVDGFLRGHIHTTIWIRSHKKETVEILSNGVAALAGESISQQAANKAYVNFVPTYDPVKPSLLKFAAKARKLGLISGKNIESIFEFSPIDTILKYEHLPPIKMIIN